MFKKHSCICTDSYVKILVAVHNMPTKTQDELDLCDRDKRDRPNCLLVCVIININDVSLRKTSHEHYHDPWLHLVQLV